MEPYYTDDQVTLYAGDCLEVMAALPDNSIDSVCTDPPYGWNFMGKAWDAPAIAAASALAGGDNLHTTERPASMHAGRYDLSRNAQFGLWCEQWAAECLRVLKPGGHMLAFGGPRTFHRLTAGIEDAGFEIRDCLMWIFGSGFPKSLDVSKSIDKAEGHWRGQAGEVETGNESMSGANYQRTPKGDAVTAAAAAAAAGWGTALKPSYEPVILARKPISGTVAANYREHGTGALNIDGCRITAADGDYEHSGNLSARSDNESWRFKGNAPPNDHGRWPANVVLDDMASAQLDGHAGTRTSGAWTGKRNGSKFGQLYGEFTGSEASESARGASSGGASRFFYTAKADAHQRPKVNGVAHPTVKPIDLMQWLARMITPPGGVILDPFAGSGTTGEAAIVEGFRCVLIEREADYLPLIVQRLSKPIEPVLGMEVG